MRNVSDHTQITSAWNHCQQNRLDPSAIKTVQGHEVTKLMDFHFPFGSFINGITISPTKANGTFRFHQGGPIDTLVIPAGNFFTIAVINSVLKARPKLTVVFE